MTSGVPLDNGGPLFHPDQDLGFHPSLRAAAHLLAAGEQAAPGLARSLREEVLPHHPPNPQILASPRLCFETDDEGVLQVAVRPLPSDPHPLLGGRDRTASALAFTRQLLDWTRRRHLGSPYVLEVLLLTLSAWRELDRRTELARADLEALPEALLAQALPGATPALCPPPFISDATPWGPWIDVLTADPAEADVAPLLNLYTSVPFLRPLDPASRKRSDTLLNLELHRWLPEYETWEEREQRLRQNFEAALEHHRRTTLQDYEAAGYKRVPVKTAHHHFGWLAERQLHGRRPSQQARKAGVSAAAVRMALNEVAELVELRLRRVKRGPEGW